MADDNKISKPSVGPLSGTRDSSRRGQTYFTSTESREGAFRAELARERKASDAKTAKLRALRMAKEEEERIAAENAPKPVKKSRAKAAKPAAAD